MHLTLTPQAGLPGQPEMTIHVDGDTITLDGVAYDLSAVPEGGEGWPEGETQFIGPIRRHNGVVHCTLIIRLDQTAAPDQQGPWTIPDASGLIKPPTCYLSPEE